MGAKRRMVACTFTGANEDGVKTDTVLTFLVPDLVPNPEILFCHQMGPEQTLRRETWTDRRQISMRVSFIFKKTKKKCVLFEPRHVKKKKRPCEERTTTDTVDFWIKLLKSRIRNIPNPNPDCPFLESVGTGILMLFQSILTIS